MYRKKYECVTIKMLHDKRLVLGPEDVKLIKLANTGSKDHIFSLSSGYKKVQNFIFNNRLFRLQMKMRKKGFL